MLAHKDRHTDTQAYTHVHTGQTDRHISTIEHRHPDMLAHTHARTHKGHTEGQSANQHTYIYTGMHASHPYERMHVRTQTHGTDRWTASQTYIHACTPARTHTRTHARTHIHIMKNERTNERNDGPTDGPTDRQIDRQTRGQTHVAFLFLTSYFLVLNS